ncbi:MAG TPA: hypothetical protein VD908_17135 [Cytophagales bacterium]|nr:hypothetical protein [Cytophagales bacterium]
MKLYKLSFFLLIILLFAFIIIKSFTHLEFKGVNGEGFNFGFALSIESIIGIIFLLLSVGGYFAIKRFSKN